MKIYTEDSISNFEFWSGAKDTAEKIDNAGKWEDLEYILEDLYPDGMSDTELNDLFWFDDDFIFQCAGIAADEE